MSKSKPLVLELVKESKIYKLLKECDANSRLEASGVFAKDDYCYVVFDNIPDIAKLNHNLTDNADNRLISQQSEGDDFEGITFDNKQQRFLVVQESHLNQQGKHSPKIEEYNLQLNLVTSKPVDFILKADNKNKGIEGLSCVNWNNKTYVLGLSEGGKKKSKKSKKHKRGKIHVFEEETNQWAHRATLELPKTARFKDYADISINGLHVAVVSQENSALWVGNLKEDGWYFADEGTHYIFPRNTKDKIIYGNIEGVSWLSPNEIVVVSDKRKSKIQAKRCKAKDQSIHIFKLPPKGIVL